MNARKVLVAVLAVGAALLIVCLLARPPETSAKGVGEIGTPGAAASAHTAEAAPPSGTEERREALPAPKPPAPAAAPLPLYPAERPSGALLVQVVDEEDRPVAGAAIQVESDIGPFPPGMEIADDRGVRRDARAGDDGSARFEDLPAGGYRVAASTEDGRRREATAAVAGAGEERIRVALPKTPRLRTFVVLVVDRENHPVPGARVEVVGGQSGRGVAGGTLPTLKGVTDSDGKASFPDADLVGAVAKAVAPDGREGWAGAWLADTEQRVLARGGLRIVVDATGRLQGRILGLTPPRLAAVHVRAAALIDSGLYSYAYGTAWTTPAIDGAYTFEALPAGRFVLDVAGDARQVLPELKFGQVSMPNSVDPPDVEVQAGRTTVQDLSVAAGGAIVGVVRRADGAPVEGAEVRETYAPATRNFIEGFLLHGVNIWWFDADPRIGADHPSTHARARTDARGRYRLPGLQPGRHRIEVWARGWSLDRREGVTVTDGEEVALEHSLSAAGALQGIYRWGYLGVTPAGDERPLVIAIVGRNGLFTFSGLPAGRYDLAQFHSDESRGKVPLASADVVAGRTTWVDLRETPGQVALTGRVIGARGPVAGASVRGERETVWTSEDGAFRFRSAVAWTHVVAFTVTVDGVETAFQFPGMPASATTWAGDLELGTHTLTVRALDREGLPAPAKVRANSQSLSSRANGWGSVYVGKSITDAQGEREIPHLCPGTYKVWAEFPSGFVAHGEVVVPDQPTMELRELEVGTVEVEARRSSGEPLEDAIVRAGTWLGTGAPPADPEAWQENGVHWAGGTTDARGQARLRGVVAGEVLVLLRMHPMGIPDSERDRHVRLKLSQGETRSLRFEVP